MPEKDKILATGADLTHAFSLLTRLPMHRAPADNSRGLAESAWAWPIAGAAIGLLAGLAGLLAAWLGAGPGIAAGVTLAALIMLSGALHEDGLADTADGLWGGQNRIRRLEIMKDSRVGSYGVLALCLSVIMRWSALAALLQSGWFLAPVIAAGMLSRVPMAVLLATLPNARGSGLAADTGQPRPATIMLMLSITLITGLLLIGWSIFIAAFWIILLSTMLATLAKAKIGGQTGDILGASQQLAEITALASLVALTT